MDQTVKSPYKDLINRKTTTRAFYCGIRMTGAATKESNAAATTSELVFRQAEFFNDYDERFIYDKEKTDRGYEANRLQ